MLVLVLPDITLKTLGTLQVREFSKGGEWGIGELRKLLRDWYNRYQCVSSRLRRG